MRLSKGSLAGRFSAVTVVAIAAALPAGAQQFRTPEVPAFHADSTLVLVPVTVVDRRGAIIGVLGSDAFTLTEDGVARNTLLCQGGRASFDGNRNGPERQYERRPRSSQGISPGVDEGRQSLRRSIS
jgi:hypothetical protein